MEVHRAEQPIRSLIAAAAKARQRRGGRQTAALRWGGARQAAVASADFAEATPAALPTQAAAASPVPSAVAEVLERAFAAITSNGDTRTKHRLLGLTSSVDEYEAIEKIIRVADDRAEAHEVRAVAAAQLAALDTAQPPAVSTALRRVRVAQHDAHARVLLDPAGAAGPAADAGPSPGDDLVDGVVAALQSCAEQLDALLTPRGAAARSISRADAGAARLRAAVHAANEIPQLIASVAEVL